MKAVYVLWLRELKKYYRSKARMIGSLGQPVLFLVALGFGLGPIYARAGGGNYFTFLAPGVISMGILFTAIFAGIQVIWDKEFGFLKETLVAPVSRFQIMLGKTLGGATVASLQGVIVFILSTIFGFRPVSWAGMAPAFLVGFIVALLFTALGVAIASTLDDFQGFQLIMNFLVQPTFFLSGALFPLHGLPLFLQVITYVNPLSYGVDGIRGTLAGSFHFGLTADLLVLSSLAAILLAIGSYLFSKIQV